MPSLRSRLHDIIFEHGSPAERMFDVVLIALIVLSVFVVMLDSVASLRTVYGHYFRTIEWGFTIAFTVEYLLRVWTARNPLRYVTSFYGLIDLLAVLPTYLSIFFPAGRFLIAFRILRVLRVFRILKLVQYVQEANVLMTALRASRRKITVFISTVLAIVVVVGSLMYLIEGPASGFTSIPESMYWAIVTLTTVGYGDIAPVTPVGKMIAAALMILGYGIIAVPTGIVTLELDRASRQSRVARECENCGANRHDVDAAYCKICGNAL